MVLAATKPEAISTEFIPLADVVSLAGVHSRVVRERLRAAGVELLADPWDSRRRVLRREDLARLLQPRPIAAKAA